MKALEELPWKGRPKKVKALYSKTLSCSLLFFLSTLGNESPEGIRLDYQAKAKYSTSPIVNQYREGKVKSSEVIAMK